MNNRVLILALVVLAILLSAGAYAIYQQSEQIRSLQDQVAKQNDQVYRLNQLLDVAEANRRSVVKLRSLTGGLHKLTARVLVDDVADEYQEYSIYNLTLNFNLGAIRTKIQLGYGSSDTDKTTLVFYLDQDSDGFIDTDMITKYAATIPGGEWALGLVVNPKLSQSVYDAFRMNIDKADPVKMEDLTGPIRDPFRRILEWLKDQPHEFSDWFEESIDFD